MKLHRRLHPVRLPTGLALLCLLLLTGCGRSPESTVEKFYRALEDGELTEATGYISKQLTGTFGERKVSAGLSSATEEIAECGGIRKIEVDLTGKGELRSGTTTVTYRGDCEPETERVKLIKEDGEWKLTDNK